MTDYARDTGTSGRPRWRRVLGWALEASFVVAVYLAVSTWQTRHLVDESTPAPDFSLRTLDGESVSQNSLRGKRVLLHFWATWCGVCRTELSTLDRVYARLGPDEVLLSVAADSDDPERLRAFVREHGIRYPVLLADARVLEDYRVDTFPTNYFLDKDGTVEDRTIGMSTRWGLSARLRYAGP
jgi:peroxiredoxin